MITKSVLMRPHGLRLGVRAPTCPYPLATPLHWHIPSTAFIVENKKITTELVCLFCFFIYIKTHYKLAVILEAVMASLMRLRWL